MILYVGGQPWSVQGERDDLTGHRCWTAAGPCNAAPSDPSSVDCLLDSGAFSDSPEDRLTPSGALDRQLAWEAKASSRFGLPWRCSAIVAYDLLIDEKWIGQNRRKARWWLAEAEAAVESTVEAAAYLASKREELLPRKLVLPCQGVEVDQYARCARAVLACASPDDWLGLGGWCVLGRHQKLLPEFFRTMRAVLPLAVEAGLSRVHLFGVLWPKALGGLLWLCDELGLEASCDSAAPILACTRGDAKKAGQRAPYWRDNVRWWEQRVGTLRTSSEYREPPRELW